MADYELYHWGIKGMKWGVRRYQNRDGTLTKLGRARNKIGSDGSSDVYGLNKKDFDPTDHKTKRKFIKEKMVAANRHLDEDFSGETLKKQIDHESDLNEAYFRYHYSKHGLDDVDALQNRYDYLAYESPGAKRFESSINRFMRDEASPRLKAAIEESLKKDGFANTWYVEKHNARQEYECLWYAYHSAYTSKIVDKMDRRSDLINKLEKDFLNWEESDERYAEHSNMSLEKIGDISMDKLQHHGIKGMKWGVRRYQNSDGSLTPAGKKRYEAKEARKELRNAKKAEKQAAKAREKLMETPLRKLNDDQLKERLARANLEKQVLDTERNVANLNPQKVSTGSKFAKDFLDKAMSGLADGGKNLARNWIEKYMTKKLGLKDEDELGELRKEVDKLRLLKDKKELTTVDSSAALRKRVEGLRLNKEWRDLSEDLVRGNTPDVYRDAEKLQKALAVLSKSRDIGANTDNVDEKLNELFRRYGLV